MTDHKIEDVSVSIVKAVKLARQLSTKVRAGGKGKDVKVHFKRFVDELDLTRGAVEGLERQFDIARNKTILSTAALSSTEVVLVELGAVFQRIEEAVESSTYNDLQKSETDALLAQLDGTKSKVLLASAVIIYATKIQKGERESLLQRQEGKIRALLYAVPLAKGESEAKGLISTNVVQPSTTDSSTNSPDSTEKTPQTSKETGPVIIGIDFGSTTSTAAFSFANSTKQEPMALDRWPDSVRWSIDGVPREQHQIQSTVYYGQYQKMLGWGEDKHEAVNPPMKSTGMVPVSWPRPGVQACSDFKYELSSPEDKDLYVAIPIDMSVEDVAADYLWHLRQSVCSQIEDQVSVGLGEAPDSLRYVMTVPASWDEKARERLGKVAKMAGFWIGSDQELTLIPGPETAILYADYLDPSAFGVGDNILVADCGGHLVEVITYEVKSKDPLRLEKCTGVSVASCGSIELTRRFKSIAESKFNKLGISNISMAKSRMRAKCMSQFNRHLKLDFGRPDFQIPPYTPRGLWAADLGTELDIPEADLEEGYMVFSDEEIYSCFDSVVDRTLDLIDDQIKAIQEQKKGLQSCLLVGGFNKCEYYSRKVQSHIAAHGLKVIQPDLSLDFAKGAVLAGLRDVRRIGQLGGDLEGRKVRDLKL